MRTNRVLAVAFSGVLFAALVSATAPAEAVDCYPPGSCNTTQTQTYSAVPGTDIAVASATAALCAGGVCVPVTVTKTVSAGELTLSISNGSTVRIKPISTGGTPTQVSADGTMIIPASGGVTITLTGLQPGSWVDVYLNSDRIFLGKAKVGADGTVQATLPLPAGVSTGEHTAQVIGTAPGGKVISAAVGLIIARPARIGFLSARPLGSEKVAAGSAVNLKAGLVSVANRQRIDGPASAKLKNCSTTVTVKNMDGKVLLASTCMTYAVKGAGKANYTWQVPASVSGKVRATFTYKDGKALSVRVRTFTIA